MEYLTLKTVTLLVLVAMIASCKKNDLIDTVDSASQDDIYTPQGWDYCKATSPYVVDPNGNNIPLFTKHYQNSKTNKLTSIDAAFWNVAAGLSTSYHYSIFYRQQQIIVIKQGVPDTAAILNFNKQGKLVNAIAFSTITDEFEREYFEFKYRSGKLYKVTAAPYHSTTSVDTSVYVRLMYDDGMNNVIKLFLSSNPVASITYSYDYSKSNDRQFYADEGFGDYWLFWYFLKYLNIFPELIPKNLLLSSYLRNDDYPGDEKKSFVHQVFDISGNLIKYQVNETYPPSAFINKIIWNVKWRKPTQ